MAGDPHALLLSGAVGIGLGTIADELVSESDRTVLRILPEKNDEIDIEKGTITIERIRWLYDATRTVSPTGRTIIIDYAERMAVPAQNAFLKLLEEPGADTRFILLSHSPETLLPTILSRVQHVALKPISLEQSNALLDSLKVTDATMRAQLLFIAKGLPAELVRLAEEDDYFQARVQVVKDARRYISESIYVRLQIAQQYKDNRVAALQLIADAMKQLSQTIAKTGDPSSLKKLTALEKVHLRLSEQGNVRLQLSAGAMV